MLHGGSHITPSLSHQRSLSSFSPPSYHWQGFGRASTKPPWFDPAKSQGRRPISLWEGDAVGVPRVCPKKPGLKAPYNHEEDNRLYRPTVPGGKWEPTTTVVEARREQRTMLERDFQGGRTDKDGRFVEYGFADKCDRYTQESRHSQSLLLANKQRSFQTTMKGLIFNGVHDKLEQHLPYHRTRDDFQKKGVGGNDDGRRAQAKDAGPCETGYMVPAIPGATNANRSTGH